MVVWMVGVGLLAGAGVARAHHMGWLDRPGLDAEAAKNGALRRYLKMNGMPDAAEVRPIKDQPPWDDHEVSLFYVDERKEVSFARAWILGEPTIHTRRYQRALTDADVTALKPHMGLAAATVTPEGECTGNAVARAECSAGRAEAAADRVDSAAGRAEHAADRTEAIVAKMDTPAPAPAKKAHHKVKTAAAQ
jgi:septal ring-binding cell division protein DamX